MKDKSRLFQNLICNGTEILPDQETKTEQKTEKKTRKKKEK